MNERIEYAGVSSAGDVIKSSADKVNQILEDIRNKTNEIATTDTWNSNAAAEFKTKFENAASKFEDFYALLTKYSTFLTNVTETYKTTDASVSDNAAELNS